MIHEDCDWAVAGECDYCGHRTNPDNLMIVFGHRGTFCDEECAEGWRREHPHWKEASDGRVSS